MDKNIKLYIFNLKSVCLLFIFEIYCMSDNFSFFFEVFGMIVELYFLFFIEY